MPRKPRPEQRFVNVQRERIMIMSTGVLVGSSARKENGGSSCRGKAGNLESLKRGGWQCGNLTQVSSLPRSHASRLTESSVGVIARKLQPEQGHCQSVEGTIEGMPAAFVWCRRNPHK